MNDHTIEEVLATITDALPDATLYGAPHQVDALHLAVDYLADALGPLLEILAHPENRDHLRVIRGWSIQYGRHHLSAPEAATLERLIAAIGDL